MIRVLMYFMLISINLFGQNHGKLIGVYTDDTILIESMRFIELKDMSRYTYENKWHMSAPYMELGFWEKRGKSIILKRDRTKFYQYSKVKQSFCQRDTTLRDAFIYVYDYYSKPLKDDVNQLRVFTDDTLYQSLKREEGCDYFKIVNAEDLGRFTLYNDGGYDDVSLRYCAKEGNCIHLYLTKRKSNYAKKLKYRVNNDGNLVFINQPNFWKYIRVSFNYSRSRDWRVKSRKILKTNARSTTGRYGPVLYKNTSFDLNKLENDNK